MVVRWDGWHEEFCGRVVSDGSMPNSHVTSPSSSISSVLPSAPDPHRVVRWRRRRAGVRRRSRSTYAGSWSRPNSDRRSRTRCTISHNSLVLSLQLRTCSSRALGSVLRRGLRSHASGTRRDRRCVARPKLAPAHFRQAPVSVGVLGAPGIRAVDPRTRGHLGVAPAVARTARASPDNSSNFFKECITCCVVGSARWARSSVLRRTA